MAGIKNRAGQGVEPGPAAYDAVGNRESAARDTKQCEPFSPNSASVRKLTLGRQHEPKSIRVSSLVFRERTWLGTEFHCGRIRTSPMPRPRRGFSKKTAVGLSAALDSFPWGAAFERLFGTRNRRACGRGAAPDTASSGG